MTLLISVALVGDVLGFLPRPEDQVREARKLLSESLAVQLSSPAAAGDVRVIDRTLRSLVTRSENIVYSELILSSGETLSKHGQPAVALSGWNDLSTLDSLIVPIFKDQAPWGEVRLQFAPTQDLGLRYLGFPLTSLMFIGFLGVACLLSFYLFLRKALKQLNPRKAVPERVHAAFEVLAEGVLILDEQKNIVLANDSFARRVHQSPESLIGKSPDGYAWDLNGKGVERYPWQIAMETGEHVMNMNLKLEVEGQQVSFTVNAAPILDQQKRSRGVLITFDDVSPLEAKNTELATMLVELNKTQKVIEVKNRELQTLATRDALTGVLNRRSFLEIGSRHFSNARQLGTPLCALMVDIDFFKKVNDNFGHQVGDQAIRAVADALSAAFRKGDCVGRYGGEEFVVILPDSGADDAFTAADELRQHISTLVDSSDLPMKTLTVSVGVASINAGAADLAELVDQADRGLYKAKETGRNQVCHFDPQYVSDSQRETKAPEAAEDDSSESLRRNLESMKERVREQADELAHRSMYDDLTSLPNRLLLHDRIEQAVSKNQRSGQPGAVISVSLSGYQKMFEIEGHEAADALISNAAKVVQSKVRAGDSISPLNDEHTLTFSRIAHNELAILVVDLDDVQAATRVAERLIEALRAPMTIGRHEVLNRVYCGIALFPEDSERPETLVRNATLARKFAERRSAHASGSAYFSTEIDAKAVKNAHIAAELHQAINKQGLEVVYQPKVHAQTRQVMGAEALARWEHPELGRVSPLDFIEVAEQLGVIHLLTNYVLEQVCRDINAGHLGDMRVSVNVSPIEMSDPASADRILGILSAHNVSPSQIGIELTESSFLNDPELGRDLLVKLRAAGVLISLDDFGTGFSSLNMLTRIPIDIIKVDRSFVSGLQAEPAKHCIVQAIMLMSRSLGMRVVAEGVSSDEEYACLTELGCSEMQGFLFARPMAIPELRAYVAKVGLRPRPVQVEQRVRPELMRMGG